MSVHALFGGTLSIGAVVLGGAVLAQAPKAPAAQPEWLMVTITQLHPGAGPEYVALQTAEVMPAQKKGGVPARHVWSTGVAGTLGEFVIVTPVKSFASFDEPSPMVKALGEEGSAALNAKTSKLAQSTRRLLARTRPDLSDQPKPTDPPAALALVTIVDVMPGRRAEFEAFVKKDVLPAMQQAKARNYNVLEIVYGDSINTYVTTIGYDNYDAMGKGHPFQVALGDDGARKLEAKVAGIISRVERFMSRYRADLSWTASPGSN